MDVIIALSKTPLPTVLVFLGGVFLLLAVVEKIGTYIKMTPQGKRIAAGIGVVMFVVGIALYVIQIQPAAAPTTAAMSTESPAQPASPTVAISTLSPAETPTQTAPPVPCLTTNVSWLSFTKYAPGSTLTVSAMDESDCAVSIKFNLKAGEWLAAYKKLDLNLLQQKQGIRFTYHGTGVRNTLELKLIETSASGSETIFYNEWPGQSTTAGKSITHNVYFRDLTCRPTEDGRCPTGSERVSIKLELVDRIDFTISNKPDGDDLPGEGEVIIEGVWTIP